MTDLIEKESVGNIEILIIFPKLSVVTEEEANHRLPDCVSWSNLLGLHSTIQPRMAIDVNEIYIQFTSVSYCSLYVYKQ